jgi:hypothetical protein
MPALNENTVLDGLKGVLEGLTVDNDYDFDVKVVSRKAFSVEMNISPEETPCYAIVPGKDSLVERGTREARRKLNVLIAAYIHEQYDAGDEEEEPEEEEDDEEGGIAIIISTLKQNTLDLLRQAYESPVDPILFVEIGDVDPSIVDEANTDADFLVSLDFHYFM